MVRLELATPGLQTCIAQWLEHWVCNPGVASSSLTIGISEGVHILARFKGVKLTVTEVALLPWILNAKKL